MSQEKRENGVWDVPDADPGLISAEEHLEIFNNIASEYLGISGKEFARRWDKG